MMTGKERVMNAVSHKPADRFPVDIWADETVWKKLMDYFGKTHEEIRRMFEIDIRYVGPVPLGETTTEPDENGVWLDSWGVGYKRIQTETGFHDDCVFHPLANMETVKEIDNYPWPDPEKFNYEIIAGACDEWKEYAVMCGYGHFFCPGADLRGYEQWFVDIAEESDVAFAIMEHMLDYWMTYSTRVFENDEGKIDIFNLADDYSSQRGLLFSLNSFRRFFRPYLQKMIDLGKSYGKKIFFHSCGAVRALIPDLIDMGVDILNPVQIRAAGMDPKELSKEYGRDICFHGGVDLQHTLCQGTPQDVRDEVNYLIDTLGHYNGYIIAPGHTIISDAPIENIIALFETANNQK